MNFFPVFYDAYIKMKNISTIKNVCKTDCPILYLPQIYNFWGFFFLHYSKDLTLGPLLIEEILESVDFSL